MIYDELYNSPGSHKKRDDSWNRYMNPANSEDKTRQRYEYSVGHLYGDVLDVGAGDGFGAYLMAQNENIKNITCVEVDDEAIRRIKQNTGIDAVKSAAEYMSFDCQFDAIHCGHTLEHVEDINSALENIKRYARDVVVLSVPINGGISHIHVREFKSVQAAKEIIHRFFTVKELRIFNKNDSIYSVVFICI